MNAAAARGNVFQDIRPGASFTTGDFGKEKFGGGWATVEQLEIADSTPETNIRQMMQIVRLPPGNMSYRPYRSFWKNDLDHQVGTNDLSDFVKTAA